MKRGFGIIAIFSVTASLLVASILSACASGQATITVTTTSPHETVTVTHTATSTQPQPTVTVTHITPPPTTSPAPGSVDNGERIYLNATSSSGDPIYSEGWIMRFRFISCADCHGENGTGGTIFMMMTEIEVPDITWPVLSSDEPPFTEDSLKSAITEGVDPAGGELSLYMPRWVMTEGDLTDLVHFVMTLGE